MEMSDFNSPVHPALIALNNIKQSILFIAGQPEVVAKLPPEMNIAMIALLREFDKVQGDTPSEPEQRV